MTQDNNNHPQNRDNQRRNPQNRPPQRRSPQGRDPQHRRPRDRELQNRPPRQHDPQPRSTRPVNPQRSGSREERLQRRRAEVRRNRIILGAVLGLILVIILVIVFSKKKDAGDTGNPASGSGTGTTESLTTGPDTASTEVPIRTTEAAPVTEAAPTTEAPVEVSSIISKDGKNVYIDKDGNMITNRMLPIDGVLYSAAADGTLSTVSGWQEVDGKKFYAEADGKLHPGEYVTVDGEDYHMDMDGAVISGAPTIDQYLGCKDLFGWMLDHQEGYYTNTNFNPMTDYPDNPEMLIRPYGEYGKDSHMNCAGFIAHLLKSAGGNLEKVSDMGLRGGYTNADNYLRLATNGYVDYYTFDSLDEMLSSGKAKKGDILYLEPNWTPGADCHIGLFWGDSPDEDKFWQQNWDCLNAVTNVRMDDPIVKIYLFPIDRKTVY